MCVCDECQNAMDLNDLCDDGYEQYLIHKWEEEMEYREYLEPESDTEDAEDAAEDAAMIRIEKGF